jgi:4'-phosphopantetheinyl transferase
LSWLGICSRAICRRANPWHVSKERALVRRWPSRRLAELIGRMAPPRDPLRVAPEPATVDVWTIGLSASTACVRAAEAVLSLDERSRSARARPLTCRETFVLAHAALRHILASYVGCPAATLTFKRSAYGKPVLHGHRLAFNLSRSGHMAVCGVTGGARVGIDVERLRPVPEASSLVERWFAPAEAAAFALVSHRQREEVFLDLWTRKEAFAKATGEGLVRPLDSFVVTVPPVEARVVGVSGRQQDACWTMRTIEGVRGCVATLAIEGPLRAIAYREWTWPMARETADPNGSLCREW